MKTFDEVWPILDSAVKYLNTASHSEESVVGCKHLFMTVWMQLGEDYSKLMPGPNNPITNSLTGIQVSFDLDEKVQNLEKFLSIHSDGEVIKPTSS